jgi:uncharacterized protein YfdQ (DUF2303 family)
MNIEDDNNIAATLSKILPEAKQLTDAGTDSHALVLAVPHGTKIETLDLEKFQPAPRRKTGTATFSDAASFAAYIATHSIDGTTAWAKFNPQTNDLAFSAVLDEHSKDTPAWRQHRAAFTPDMSAEWKTWIGKDKKSFTQTEFAEFIEANGADIAPVEGSPTDLQMLQMATNFIANEDRTLKSAIRLQSGGVNLSYVADVDAGTVETMRMFDKFTIGIPVFQDGSAYAIVARLKYRLNAGKVSFFYELIRLDRVHRTAALGQIATIRESLGAVPLLMGTFA